MMVSQSWGWAQLVSPWKWWNKGYSGSVFGLAVVVTLMDMILAVQLRETENEVPKLGWQNIKNKNTKTRKKALGLPGLFRR